MDYVSRYGKTRKFRCRLATHRKAISFYLPDPPTWQEEEFLKIVWQVTGDLCHSVVLRDVYHDLLSGKVAHNYDVFLYIGEKILRKKQANELMAVIEDRCVAELHVDMRGRSHRKIEAK